MKIRERQELAEEVYRRLNNIYGIQHCALHYTAPHELMAAAILSAQCTDVRVNIVTKVLFKRYPDVASFAEADLAEVEEIIRPVGFFRNKAAAIVGSCRAIMADHGGELPRTKEELTALSGIGRKTANVILGDAFGVPGFPVDTHVNRLLNRIGVTAQHEPEKIEAEINRFLPEEYWVNFSHLLITHGRQVCHARNPRCPECVLYEICRFPGKK